METHKGMPLRALIVEDSEDDCALLVRALKRGGYAVAYERVDTAEALNAALSLQQWDIVFGDYSMPHFSGTAALKALQEKGLDLPFIFVSGTIGEDTAVAAMKAGAHDYIMKGNLKRLPPAVERELREAASRQERRRAEEELRLLQTVTHAAGQAGDVQAALAATLKAVCETGPWTLAQAWMPGGDGRAIECCPGWHCRDAGLEPFHAASLSLELGRGEGLPGRVWSSGQALWVQGVATGTACPRAAAAQAAGLGAAMGIPVLVEDQVAAVLEFFMCERRSEDGRIVQLTSTVATQLGGIIQRKRAEERLQYLAHYDTLTGLPNRMLFNDRLAQAQIDANRHDRFVGVAFLDLDRFKNINDSLGHGIGDLLLKEVAERLVRAVREGDTVARLSGDEFALVLADMAHPEDITRVAGKILDTFATPFHIAGHELFGAASLGLTLYPPDDTSADGLLRNADIAMYRAKESGGNAYQFYAPDMTSKANARLSLENALRRALEREQFLLHYQPVVDLRSGQITGVEALIRWQSPEHGLVSPRDFIPLAEETGLIVPIGEWALDASCRQCRSWQPPGGSPLRVAVNVSPRQFQHHALPATISKIIERTGFDPACLEIEITESLLLQNSATVVAAMQTLSALGMQFSIDDFGTGYSSLAYLKRLPIRRLKIDGSFVQGIPADANGVAIVVAIIAMAHSLGIEVIAEGVERQEQLEFLRSQGCYLVQGFYFSPPLPAEELVLLLQKQHPFPLPSP